MSTPNAITVAGNLTADPEISASSSEHPRTKLRLAVSRRIFVTETSTWEDRQDGYFTVVCWREMARAVHRSLRKGDRVVISGRLSRRPYEVAGGDGSAETRHAYEIEADEVGASLRWDVWTRQPRERQPSAPHPAGAVSSAAPDVPSGSLREPAARAGSTVEGTGSDEIDDPDVTAAA